MEPLWRQASARFAAWDAAEQTAAADIAPLFAEAEHAGLIVSWFFTRKAPCWRLRFLPPDAAAAVEATRFIHRRLDALAQQGRIARWAEAVYEPETCAFGGPAAMDTAHRLFHQDSRHVLAYLGSGRASAAAGRGGQRRELSILLCSLLMRSAGQDWYEQGDVWARVAEHRPAPTDTPDPLHALQPHLRRLMTVDSAVLTHDDGPLAVVCGWADAFAAAGAELAGITDDGGLRRGLRAVLAHHVIFAWNRIGLPHTTQSLLANAAKAVVLDH